MATKMETDDYAVGGLSNLIAKKGAKTKKGRKKSSKAEKKNEQPPISESENTENEIDNVHDSDDKLNQMFSDPQAEMFKEATEEIEENDDGEESDDENSKRRKEVRDKSKLSKQRKEEKKEAAPRTIFIGNVSLKAGKKNLLKLFRRFGVIDSVRFRSQMRKDLKTNPRASAIKKEFHSNSKVCNAYIIFKNEESVKKALSMNGREYMSHHLRVDTVETEKKEHYNKNNSVFVGNIAFNAHEDQLRSHFANCGQIKNVRLIRDRDTKLGKGFGYVEFSSPDGVALALQMDGSRMGTKALRIQRCLDSQKLQTLSVKAKKKLIEKQDDSHRAKERFNPKNKKNSAAKTAATPDKSPKAAAVGAKQKPVTLKIKSPASRSNKAGGKPTDRSKSFKKKSK